MSPQRHLAASHAPEIIRTAARGCGPATGGQLLEGPAVLMLSSQGTLLEAIMVSDVAEWDGGSPAG